jgi:methionine-rich copper-binding protein CopC
MMKYRSSWLATAVLLACLSLVAAPAFAHAIIVAATPAVDSVVKGPTVGVTLRFNSRIDHGRSRLTLLGADGKEVTLPLAADNRPDTLQASAAGVSPGHYRLRWQVLAVDGHITRGDVPFDVAE